MREGDGGGNDNINDNPYDDTDADESYHFQYRLAKTPVYNGEDVLRSIEPSLQSKIIQNCILYR